VKTKAYHVVLFGETYEVREFEIEHESPISFPESPYGYKLVHLDKATAQSQCDQWNDQWHPEY